MSTRSYICKKLEDGKILGIYCHHDGDIGHNGRILATEYNYPQKVDELLALGDLSVLAENIYPISKTHSMGNPEDGVCLAYGRDGNQDDVDAKIIDLKSEKFYPWIEYVYLYEKGCWKVAKIRSDNKLVFRKLKMEYWI